MTLKIYDADLNNPTMIAQFWVDDPDNDPRAMFTQALRLAYDIGKLIDALDHILRVSRQSNTRTRRLKWIQMRAESALEGNEAWRDYDIPKNRTQARERLRERLRLAEKAVAELTLENGRLKDRLGL